MSGRQAAPGSLAAIRAANDQRTVAAASRTVGQAKSALGNAGGLSRRDVEVLAARVTRPHLPLADLAAELHMTKDSYAAHLRRVLRRAQGLPTR